MPEPICTVAVIAPDPGSVVTLDVALRNNGTEAWFTTTCPCGCDEGGIIVSTDPEAVWLAAGLIATVERLTGASHGRRSA